MIEFEKTAPSVQYRTLIQMMKSRFDEVFLVKEHRLGDRLEALSRFCLLYAALWLLFGVFIG